VKAIANTLGVSRSALHDRLKGSTKARGSYFKADDATVLPMITALVSARPTYGYRRITAILNRQLRVDGAAPVNHKRVYRIMRAHALLLARKYEIRPDYGHEGKVVTMRSNLRWCSDGFEFHCWNGDVVRGAFIIDAHDREIISWRAVVNAGISGSDVRDMMLEAVERRFNACQASLSDRNADGQWLALYRKGDEDFRKADRPQALLHPSQKPAKQRHFRGLREHIETRLRTRLTITRCRQGAALDRCLVR